MEFNLPFEDNEHSSDYILEGVDLLFAWLCWLPSNMFVKLLLLCVCENELLLFFLCVELKCIRLGS